MSEELYNSVWVHTATKKRYVITHVGKVRIEEEWRDCYTYIGEDSVYYTRTKLNFEKNFHKEIVS